MVYSKAQVDDLLEMIATGNRSTGGMREVTKFYGIVGFVRFTEGYYITLITKRSPVALIGGHYIFHIDATSSISVHSSTTPTSKLDKNSDEARYLQMFQMVDLTKNFYFSYSYDITRTLQWNMTRNPQVEGRNRMFVWNQYLLENAFGAQTGIENQWALPIMYGFVDQSSEYQPNGFLVHFQSYFIYWTQCADQCVTLLYIDRALDSGPERLCHLDCAAISFLCRSSIPEERSQ